MTQQISGINAAQMEKDGLGCFNVQGKTVTFNGNDGRSVSWTLGSGKLAEFQLRFFRAATKGDVKS